MAAIEIPANATSNLNEEERVALEKFVNEYNGDISNRKPVKDVELGVKTTGYMINLHKVNFTNMHMIYSKEWSGASDPDMPVPKGLGWWPLRPLMFAHDGPVPAGSVAGFVYADGTADDSTARKWLVAFDSGNNKVWVEAGPMGPVDWDGIKFKLDNLAGPKCVYTDPVLGGKASASINNYHMVAIFSN